MLERWLELKRSRPRRSIEFEITEEGKFQRIIGPKGDFGRIRLTARPSETFSFRSSAEWNSEGDNYDDSVFEGIVDELYSRNLGPAAANTEFILEEIWWHPVDGSANAFYQAARDAVRNILKSEIERKIGDPTGANKPAMDKPDPAAS